MPNSNDFIIRTSLPVITAEPSESIVFPLTILNPHKEWRKIQLNVTGHWSCAGIFASAGPSEIYPPGGLALSHVIVSSTTPPGSYSFGIKGKTDNTVDRIPGAKVKVIVQCHGKTDAITSGP
jgi:hypothetical protein